jgi:hypothetical protein
MFRDAIHVNAVCDVYAWKTQKAGMFSKAKGFTDESSRVNHINIPYSMLIFGREQSNLSIATYFVVRQNKRDPS